MGHAVSTKTDRNHGNKTTHTDTALTERRRWAARPGYSSRCGDQTSAQCV